MTLYIKSAFKHNIKIFFSSFQFLLFIDIYSFLKLDYTLANAKIDELFAIGIEIPPEERNPSQCFCDFYPLEWHFVFILFGENFVDLLNFSPDFDAIIFHSMTNNQI